MTVWISSCCTAFHCCAENLSPHSESSCEYEPWSPRHTAGPGKHNLAISTFSLLSESEKHTPCLQEPQLKLSVHEIQKLLLHLLYTTFFFHKPVVFVFMLHNSTETSFLNYYIFHQEGYTTKSAAWTQFSHKNTWKIIFSRHVNGSGSLNSLPLMLFVLLTY